MNEQLNTIFNKLAKDSYQEVKAILSNKKSYTQKVNLKVVKQILKYLEKTLDEHFDYLHALNIIIYQLSQNDLPDALVPFRFLSYDASEVVSKKIELGSDLYRCVVSLQE